MKRICKFLFSRYAICAVFIILGIAILVPAFWLSDNPELLYLFSALLMTVAVVQIVNRNINPEYKVSWLIIVAFLPYVGVVLYFLFSRRKISRKEARMFSQIVPAIAQVGREGDSSATCGICESETSIAPKVRTIIMGDYLAALHTSTKSEYFGNGAALFLEIKRRLATAKRYIFLEYFIIDDGVMWGEILEILTERVAAGVEIRILYDDVGCMTRLPPSFSKLLAARGIKCEAFSKITPIATAVHNNRDHRKLLIIDGTVAFTGGVNIADEYIGRRERFGEWHDGGILIEGDAAATMAKQFLAMWDITTRSVSDYKSFIPCESVDCGDGGYYLPFGSGPLPLYPVPVGKNAFLCIINQSLKYVYITTPYLIIDFDLTEALTAAARRGVDVRIITPGVADKKIIKVMTKSSYRYLIGAGVKIYEFTPGFIHEKLMVSDDECAIVGTINLDYRSLVHHFENAVFMAKTPTVTAIRDSFNQTLSRSERVGAKGTRLGFFEWLAKLAVRVFAPLL